MLDASDVWPGWLALIPVAGTALLILAADQTSVVTNNKLSASIGKASYSIYLWHWPMVVLLGYYGVSDSTIAIAAGVAASILLGYASLHFVETPFQKLKSQDVTIPLSEYKSRNQFVVSVMEDAAKSCGILPLDPEPELCDAQYCYGSINGKPLYWDDNHMSESGNKKLIPVFRSIWN